jgi:hypothetical protein
MDLVSGFSSKESSGFIITSKSLLESWFEMSGCVIHETKNNMSTSNVVKNNVFFIIIPPKNLLKKLYCYYIINY